MELVCTGERERRRRVGWGEGEGEGGDRGMRGEIICVNSPIIPPKWV
jgi:hypothetical protein